MLREKRSVRHRQPENLVRRVEINRASLGVSFGTKYERHAEPEIDSSARVELAGTMDEPVQDTRDVEIVVYSTDSPRVGKNPVPWIGLVHGIKPTIRPSLFLSRQDFEGVWTLARSLIILQSRKTRDPAPPSSTVAS